MQDELRKSVKLLKALQGISYAELSQYLEIKKNSFYNWLSGYYELSKDKEQLLKDIVSTLTQ